MLRNFGGAFGTAILATIITKREQHHSNIVGTAVRLLRETASRSHRADGWLFLCSRSEARHQAVIAIGNIVHKRSLIMGFSERSSASWCSRPPRMSC
jgi:MFS transporter, DHA2 family, multidrug resistance protein